MVFKKLLAGLGLGGVEVDTVLSPHPGTPGGPLSGHVNLRAKSDTDINAIGLILVANGPMGEVDLGRTGVAGPMKLASRASQSVPFTFTVPPHTPFTVLYGQNLPGINVGVRTEVSVASGSAKGDFDPARIDATEAHQHIVDALGTIGCRFVRNELRPGSVTGLPVPAAQAITFYAPIPEGQQPGPHIPQITFVFAGDPDGMTVVTELAARPGTGDRQHLSTTDIDGLTSREGGWIAEVDRWIVNALDKLASGAPTTRGSGAFLQPHQQGYGPPQHQPYGAPGHGHGRPGQHGYAYSGHGGHHGGYKYSGYHGKPGMGMGGAIAAGVGGAALGFLGGMVIGDMIGDAMVPDMADAAGAAEAAGFEDPGLADAGFEDFGGGFEEF